jgi:hypothetical protein
MGRRLFRPVGKTLRHGNMRQRGSDICAANNIDRLGRGVPVSRAVSRSGRFRRKHFMGQGVSSSGSDGGGSLRCAGKACRTWKGQR